MAEVVPLSVTSFNWRAVAPRLLRVVDEAREDIKTPAATLKILEAFSGGWDALEFYEIGFLILASKKELFGVWSFVRAMKTLLSEDRTELIVIGNLLQWKRALVQPTKEVEIQIQLIKHFEQIGLRSLWPEFTKNSIGQLCKKQN